MTDVMVICWLPTCHLAKVRIQWSPGQAVLCGEVRLMFSVVGGFAGKKRGAGRFALLAISALVGSLLVVSPAKAATSSTQPSSTGSPTVGANEALTGARDRLAEAKAAVVRNTALLTKAKQNQTATIARIAALGTQIQRAQATLVQAARETYMLGASPDVLAGVDSLSGTDMSTIGQTQQVLNHIVAVQNQDRRNAEGLLASVQAQRTAVEAAVVTAQQDLNSAIILEAASRQQLASAESAVTNASTAKTFSTFAVNPCSFDTPANPSTCEQAQQWALAEVANPSRDWYRSCLNFVTNAYGVNGGAPSAIAMWNSLPSSDKHPPTTVAPAGALMFWGPNHVALSLGNNVLISTDVLGNGRAWIVSFAEMQTAWHLQYLGWAPPDFANGH